LAIAELVGHGFVEISIANAHDAIAKVTQAEARIRIGLCGYDGISGVVFDCNDWLFVRLRRVGRLMSARRVPQRALALRNDALSPRGWFAIWLQTLHAT
jgi:hypothetical protein